MLYAACTMKKRKAPKNKVINFRLPDEYREFLAGEAERQDRTQLSVLTKALKYFRAMTPEQRDTFNQQH